LLARYLGLTARRVTRRPLDHAAAATHAKARSLPSPRVVRSWNSTRCDGTAIGSLAPNSPRALRFQPDPAWAGYLSPHGGICQGWRDGHLRLLARCLSPGKLGGGSFQIATVALLEPAVLPSDRTGPVGANVARASLPSSFLGFPCLSLATLARGGGRCQPCIFTFFVFLGSRSEGSLP